ncbi:hypothetical protein ETB97_000252 [Aspergillus alliaceus]|uniref:Rieske domain-containing protein n=2 Tax=Petromyces alliaceus TaxID=209559 RepID=A0A8H6ABC2_PETAA|nr:hypothetical protein ETB97_000252 [Aspergillus burnettii]
MLTIRSNRPIRAGDYQSYEVAGFPIFLILGKDGEVRAFHNVCRHRAYTVTRKEHGSSAVLGCRYHGWSYNTYGELTKAPHFDEIPGFDRSQNSLFAIHTVTNEAGLVFVNLEASPTVSTTDTSLLDAFARKNRLDHQSIWVSGQTIEADFNWKMALRSKQLTTVVGLEDAMGKKNSIPLVASIRGYFQVKLERFSFPPFTSFHLIRGTGWWCALSFLPISEQKTAVRYDLYCSKNESSRSQEAAAKLVDILREKIRELEAMYAENQEISASGPSSLHSNVLDTQKNILNRLEDHVKLEKAQGTEIFPAMRKPRENPKFQQAEQLCKELDCKIQLATETSIMMALPPIAKATLQAAVINAGSNVLAQSIQSYRDEKPFELDLQTLFQFTTCAFVMSPMTFLWLEGLELALPGYDEKPATKPKKGNGQKEKKLNVKNTVAKIVIDQIVGGAWATVLFSLTMGLLRGQEYDALVEQVRNEFWPFLIAGFKLWPFVSVLNFTVVPADKRLLVGSMFGVVWGVYLSLMSG